MKAGRAEKGRMSHPLLHSPQKSPCDFPPSFFACEPFNLHFEGKFGVQVLKNGRFSTSAMKSHCHKSMLFLHRLHRVIFTLQMFEGEIAQSISPRFPSHLVLQASYQSTTSPPSFSLVLYMCMPARNHGEPCVFFSPITHTSVCDVHLNSRGRRTTRDRRVKRRNGRKHCVPFLHFGPGACSVPLSGSKECLLISMQKGSRFA